MLYLPEPWVDKDLGQCCLDLEYPTAPLLHGVQIKSPKWVDHLDLKALSKLYLYVDTYMYIYIYIFQGPH